MPKRVVVAGAGGVAGWLLEGIARFLEFQDPGSVLMIVDGDHFEPRNQERQVFTQLGNKAEVKANELSDRFKNTFIVPMSKWIVDSMDNAESDGKILASELLAEEDIVFCVVDNFACRKLVFDAARNVKDIDVFTGGNDDGLFGSVYHYRRRDGVDVTDHPEVMHAEYENPPDRNPGALSCQERAMLEGGQQVVAANMAVAAFLLGRFHKVIFGGEEDLEAEIYFDLGLGLALAHDRRSDDELARTNSQEIHA